MQQILSSSDDDISKIKDLAKEIVCLYSDNDPCVPFEAIKDFADKTSTKQELIVNGGHLNNEVVYNTFEEVLKYL